MDRSRQDVRVSRRGGRMAILLAGGACLLAACAAPRPILLERGPQAYYQTARPLHDTSRALERAFRSLRLLAYTGVYETYEFPADVVVTERDLADPAVLARASERYISQQSKSGSAVIIARSPTHVALLTNDHVVSYPARKVHFVEEEGRGRRREDRRVASVAILRNEWGTLARDPAVGRITVLARDSDADLAVVEVRIPDMAIPASYPPIPIRPGNPRRLGWGSFIYVMGFPGGYPMVTTGIVSDPNRDRNAGFLTDGLWNEGISGGAIFAIRGDDGSLEWVGMPRASAGRREISLQPATPDLLEADLPIRYDGPIYAETALRIQYGITLSVSMTAIQEFLDRNRSTLLRRGYELTAVRPSPES
jgi:S1-C subfamily serine protease